VGEAAQGEHPLDPSFVGFFYQPSDYRNRGDSRAAGAEAQCAKSPQERLLVSLQGFNKATKHSTLEKYYNGSRIRAIKYPANMDKIT